MPRFHVYKTHERGRYKVIDTTDCKSANEVDMLIANTEKKVMGSIHWYGVECDTKEQAIEAAIKAGYQYYSPEEMEHRNLINSLITRNLKLNPAPQ